VTKSLPGVEAKMWEGELVIQTDEF
jgi:hypothetical protein